MKIVLIGPVYPYRGGIAHHTMLLAKALESAGHTVRVVSFKRQYPKWAYPGKSDRDPSLTPLTLSADYILDPLNPLTWYAAARQIIHESPDLVLLQWWTTFWALADAFIAKKLSKKGVRVGYLIHNVIPHEPRFWDSTLARHALLQGNSYIVQSIIQREALGQLIPNAKIEMAELPINDQFSSQKHDKGAARRKLNLPDALPIVLFFGIVRPYKGLSLLVDAMGLLASQGHTAGLYIAGEFWEDEQIYRRQIKDLGLEDNVWIDNRYIPDEELPDIFAAADIFAAPYFNATQSAAVKMAMGFGLPVAATRVVIDGLMQPWIGKHIHISPDESSVSFAQTLTKALNSPGCDDLYQESHSGWEALIRSIARMAGTNE